MMHGMTVGGGVAVSTLGIVGIFPTSHSQPNERNSFITPW
jgi:hypothetical protein